MTEETTLSYRLHVCQLYKKKLNTCTEKVLKCQLSMEEFICAFRMADTEEYIYR